MRTKKLFIYYFILENDIVLPEVPTFCRRIKLEIHRLMEKGTLSSNFSKLDMQQ